MLFSALRIGRGSNCKKEYANKCYTKNCTSDHSSEHMVSMMDVILLTTLETINSSIMTLFRGVGLFLDTLSLLLFWNGLEFLDMSHLTYCV
jgi:hypothetical protein